MLLSLLLFSLAALVLGAPTLTDLSIGDIINSLGIGLVANITVTITLESLETNLVDVAFTVKNPLPIELTLERVASSAGINSTEYASFDHTFSDPLVVPIFGTADSGVIENVLLTQGALASLSIIPLGYLDLLNTDVNLQAGTIFGQLGIPLNITGLKQEKVPTTYELSS
ncbi:uncharacterized protein BT62DRAFT_926136 [Guyanagaster necrorhizus]|uniref:Water stress and hypersensitive response domain-containing protein n=1 Tax=Guyanagaster necrorhizus TaxID=856835 RepID=A0A9P8AXT5_9AGAR|nr:uncharacterized protein BT62DRAFT_926136 [Guyanagaster necrorhizus MCA 3950]KAG7451938.1 hypothetical protein BT62DRAFT_926136 [Guyanagaster necrorhizus MCA 3950]